MTGQPNIFILILLASVPAVISGFIGFFLAYKIEIVRRDVNSKMDAFIKVTRQAGFAEGVKSETDRQKEK